jgi:membrane-bound lytic murein transglycosylase D
VPKLIAISAIIAEPDRYDVELPRIGSAPAVAEISVTRAIDLDEAARLAGVSHTALADLNPGLLGNRVDPRHVKRLLVPANSAERLVAGLRRESSRQSVSADSGDIHVVQRGDNLSTIASAYGIGVDEIKVRNGLSGDILQVGQQLRIPQRRLAFR